MKYVGTIGISRADHFVISWHFSICLLNLMRYCDKVFGPGAVKLVITESSLLEENRAGVVMQAEGDWLLMLDTDMTFPKDIAEKMVRVMNSGIDFLTGLYFMGYYTCPPAIYRVTSLTAKPERYTDYPRNALFEVGGCGFGGVMMSKKLLDEFREPDAFGRVVHLGKKMGEDLSFCWKAREKGYKLWCDSSIALGHLRPYTLSEGQGPAKLDFV